MYAQPNHIHCRPASCRRRRAILVFAVGGVVACCSALLTPFANDSAASPQVVTSESLTPPALIEPSITLLALDDEIVAIGDSRLDVETINQRRQELATQITDITARLAKSATDRKTSEAKITSLTKLLDGLTDKTLPADDESSIDSVARLRLQLAQLESQAQELSVKMNESHPRLAALRLRIADGRQKLANQEVEKRPVKPELHARRQSLESALAAERTRIEALTSGEQQLIESRAELRGELAALPARSGTNLEHNPPLAAAATPKSEPVHAELPARASFATNGTRASSPILHFGLQRLMMLALGLCVALAAAIGSALMTTRVGPRIVSAAELEAIWDLPLIGIIPNDQSCPTSGARFAS